MSTIEDCFRISFLEEELELIIFYFWLYGKGKNGFTALQIVSPIFLE